jgi:hypothetical protein
MIIDDSVLSRIAAKAHREGFSFAAYLRKKRTIKNCCGPNLETIDPDFNAAKASIASMNQEAKKRFLRLLGASSAKLVFQKNGVPQSVTIT